MSHELRTPRNAIIGHAQLLDIGLAGSLTEQQRGFLQRMAGSRRHLEDLKRRKGADTDQPHRIAYKKLVRA